MNLRSTALWTTQFPVLTVALMVTSYMSHSRCLMAILTRSKSACTKSLQYDTSYVVCSLMIIKEYKKVSMSAFYLLIIEDALLLSLAQLWFL